MQPAASAGPSLYATSSSGKFHGVIAATTPTGSRLAIVNIPGIEFGSTLPSIFVVQPAVVAQQFDGQRDVDGLGLPHRLAVVEHLDRCELLLVGLEEVGELPHQASHAASAA